MRAAIQGRTTAERKSDFGRIVWVTRSFLDYRVPVFAELDKLCAGRLYLLFSGDYVPASVQAKARTVLGDRAIALHGEWKMGREDKDFLANRNFSFRLHPALFREIRKIQPDVLVCDGFFKWTLAALLYRMIYRVPLVVNYERTFHTERDVQWFRTWFRKRVIHCIDAMCCSGSLCREYARSLGMPESQITLGHMAADVQGFHENSARVSMNDRETLRRQWQASGFLFLCVGRLVPGKGCRELIRVWEQFEGRRLNRATLIFAGTGELDQELKDYQEAHGLHNVRFAGAVPHELLAKYYAAADLLVVPTLEDNWSLVVPEAMACGLPVLCSKYNGCWPELVKEDKNGWIFDPLDSAGFHAALERALSAADRLRAMGEESLRILLAGHTPEHAGMAIAGAIQMAIAYRNKEAL